jgi:hypothetical protein
MINLDERHPHQYAIMLLSFLMLFVVLYGIAAYVIVSINSSKILPNLGVANYCKIEKQRTYEAKLISYNKPKGEVKLFCLYNNKDHNRILLINRVNDRWVLSSDQLMYRSKWVWPIY